MPYRTVRVAPDKRINQGEEEAVRRQAVQKRAHGFTKMVHIGADGDGGCARVVPTRTQPAVMVLQNGQPCAAL